MQAPLSRAYLVDIPRNKLPEPRQRTILDESHGIITHERRQPSNQAYRTICGRSELGFDGQLRWLSPRLQSPPISPGTNLVQLLRSSFAPELDLPFDYVMHGQPIISFPHQKVETFLEISIAHSPLEGGSAPWRRKNRTQKAP